MSLLLHKESWTRPRPNHVSPRELYARCNLPLDERSEAREFFVQAKPRPTADVAEEDGEISVRDFAAMSDFEPQLIKPAECPKCLSTDVRRIIYGRPTPESFEKIQRGEAALGHCFLEAWLPDWRCGVCRHEWFVADDPVKQEMEMLLQRILQNTNARQGAKEGV